MDGRSAARSHEDAKALARRLRSLAEQGLTARAASVTAGIGVQNARRYAARYGFAWGTRTTPAVVDVHARRRELVERALARVGAG